MSEFFSDLKMILSPSVLKREIRQVLENDYVSLAGQLAYFFVLFLLPFHTRAVALVGTVVKATIVWLAALTLRVVLQEELHGL